MYIYTCMCMCMCIYYMLFSSGSNLTATLRPRVPMQPFEKPQLDCSLIHHLAREDSKQHLKRPWFPKM